MKEEKGQIALIVLLISAIALTLGLSVSDRIRTNVKVDKDDELLQRAFNAAESGIENYIVQDEATYTARDGSTASINVVDVGGTIVEFGQYVPKDEYGYFWLVGHDNDGNIDEDDAYSGDEVELCFNDFGGGFLVYYFGRVGTSYAVDRKAYNLDASSLVINNGILATTTSVGVCPGYHLKMSLDLSVLDQPLALVIKPVSGGTKLALKGNTLPNQGRMIISEGRSGDTSTTIKMMQKFDLGYYLSFLLEGVVSGDNITSD